MSDRKPWRIEERVTVPVAVGDGPTVELDPFELVEVCAKLGSSEERVAATESFMEKHLGVSRDQLQTVQVHELYGLMVDAYNEANDRLQKKTESTASWLSTILESPEISEAGPTAKSEAG